MGWCLWLWVTGVWAQANEQAASAQNPVAVLLNPTMQEMPLSGHLQMLRDPLQRSTPEAVANADGWVRIAGMPQAGITHDAIWLRWRVVVPMGSPQAWRLGVMNWEIDDLRFWTPAPQGGWTEQRAGVAAPRSSDAPLNRTPLFVFTPAAGEHWVYLRMQGDYYSLSTRLRLWSDWGHQLHAQQEALVYGCYLGVFVAVLVLQLFYCVWVREPQAIWYLLYTVMLLFGNALGSGYLRWWFDLSSRELVAPLLGVYLALAPLAMVRLTSVWLNLRHHLPRLGKLYEGCAWGVAGMCLILVTTGQYGAGLRLAQLATLGWLLVSFVLGLWLWRRRVPDAGNYLAVFGFIQVGIAVRFLRNLGLVPTLFMTEYAVFVGVTLHLLVMSLYFVRRYQHLQTSLASERRARDDQHEFTNLVSHEFRTPLAIITTSTQQLLANLDAPVEKSYQRGENIRNAVHRMTALLDDYLSMDRLDTAQQSLRPRACDLYEVIEEAASDWTVEQVRLKVDSLPEHVVCDPDLIRIVCRNLLANAIRHSPPGAEVTVTAQSTATGVEITVTDRGEGIPADELPRVFQRYFRGKASQGHPGAGLGLHLSQRIAQVHGGRLTVSSLPGQGCAFTLHLPLKPKGG